MTNEHSKQRGSLPTILAGEAAASSGPSMSNQFKRLGELLVSHGLITNLQLSIGLAAQTTSNRRIGDILVERGFVTEEQIARALAEQYGYPLADLSKAHPQPAALIAVGPDNALSLGVLPLRLSEESFECIIADPVDVVSTDQLSHLLRRRVILQIAPKTALLNFIRSTFGLDEPISQEIFAEIS